MLFHLGCTLEAWPLHIGTLCLLAGPLIVRARCSRCAMPCVPRSLGPDAAAVRKWQARPVLPAAARCCLLAARCCLLGLWLPGDLASGLIETD